MERQTRFNLAYFVFALIAMLLAGCDESGGGNRNGTILDKSAATRR